MRPVTRTPPCKPKAHPETQGCGQARGTAPGSPAPLAPQSLLRAPPNRGHTMSLRSTAWRLHVARRRSAVLRAAQGGCPCDRAFPAPGAPPSQVGHPAPHASSGLCRGLSHLGDRPTAPSAWDAPPPVGCRANGLPPGLCHPPPSPRPAQPARGWQPAPPCPAGPPQGTPLACVLCEAFVTAFDLRLSSQLEHKSQESQDRCPDQHLVGTEYILVKSKHKKQRA